MKMVFLSTPHLQNAEQVLNLEFIETEHTHTLKYLCRHMAILWVLYQQSLRNNMKVKEIEGTY